MGKQPANGVLDSVRTGGYHPAFHPAGAVPWLQYNQPAQARGLAR